MSFDSVELGTIILHQKGLAFKSKDYKSMGHPVVRVSNFTSDSISNSDLKFVGDEIASQSKKVELRALDIVIATVGSWPSNPASIVGKTIMVPQALNGALLNQNSVRLRVLSDSLVDQEYLFYALKNQKFSDYLISTAQGSANQASITIKDILKYQVPWPEECVRKNIVSIIGDVRKKIEINTQTNQTLEQIAQAIFKSWFVDFDPVKAKIETLASGGSAEDAELAAMSAISAKTPDELHHLKTSNPDAFNKLAQTAALFPAAMQDSELGEIPDGWSAGTLSDVAKYCSTRISTDTLTLENYISTENMLAEKKGVIAASKLPTAKTVAAYKSGNILVSNIRPYFKKIWLAEGNGGRSNDVLGFEPKEPNTDIYLMNLLYQDKFFEYMMRTSKGVKMPRGDKAAIMNWKIVLASVELRQALSEIVNKFYKLTPHNRDQNEMLESLRKILLPKLLSGELLLTDFPEVINV